MFSLFEAIALGMAMDDIKKVTEDAIEAERIKQEIAIARLEEEYAGEIRELNERQ